MLTELTTIGVNEKLSRTDAVSIMMDLWGSPTMDGYAGFGCSGVTNSFEPFTCFLGMKKMPHHHTALAIKAEYDQTVEHWGLDDKVI